MRSSNRMKHYKIIGDKLTMTDSSPFVLILPFIGIGFTIVSLIITLISNRHNEVDAFTILTWVVLILSVCTLIWALLKKTFESSLLISQITQVKQNTYNATLYYLVFNNGKQRNLTEITNTRSATELLMMLREQNPSISANFTENKILTR